MTGGLNIGFDVEACTTLRKRSERPQSERCDDRNRGHPETVIQAIFAEGHDFLVLHTRSLDLWLFSVAIICRSGAVETANYVTFPAPNTLKKAYFLAALSVILFNKVKHLGRISGNLHE